MKIYTYKDPYKLKERDYWNEIIEYPNLCASQTLKLGLVGNEKLGYTRDNYGYICTVDEVLEKLYPDWTEPTREIKQFNSITKHIDNISDENIRQSFRFNKPEVVSSLRMLIELDISPNEIDEGNILIKELKKIYLEIYKKPEWELISYLEENRLEDGEDPLKDIFFGILHEEKDRHEKEGIDLKLSQERVENTSFKKMVIQGVHRFTPLLLKMIEEVGNQGVELIFLINYIEEFPEIYNTWIETYKWTGLPFIKTDEIIRKNYSLGEAIGNLLNGKIEELRYNNVHFREFDNLSSFSDYVSDRYTETIEEKSTGELKKIGNISKMKEQFYAVEMDEVNSILKQYHPAQFGEKHFLAYPIGQFILSLYNMWDDKAKELILNSSDLRQCLSLGFLEKEGKSNLLDIYNRLEDYYEMLELSSEYSINTLHLRLDDLRIMLAELDAREADKQENTLLRKFSFYNLSFDDLDYFRDMIAMIKNISDQLFKNTSAEINFYEHYSKLIKIIGSEIDQEKMTIKEKNMINELSNRFEDIDDVNMEGTIEDLKHSLHFYLGRIEEIDDNKNQANWIVRNFEQLDGGILQRSANKENRAYHIGLVGNKDMNVPVSDMLPWPLDKVFFDGNDFKDRRYEAVINSYKERSSFLRYSLFYATYFLKNRINISYIKNYPDESNDPYYIFDILGIEFKDDVMVRINKGKGVNDKKENDFNYGNALSEPISSDEARNFQYCKYKYFLEEVIEGETSYNNYYLQQHYYKTLLEYMSMNDLNNKVINRVVDKNNITTEMIKETIKNNNRILKSRFLPIWKGAIFKDGEKKAISSLRRQIDKYDTDTNSIYWDIRKKFIHAQIRDEESDNTNVILPLWSPKENNISKAGIIKALRGDEELDKADHISKCEFCGQSEICLERYRDLE